MKKRLIAAVAALSLAACSSGVSAETVRIESCYDGNTCSTSTGEKIRLACIDTSELRGRRKDPVPARAARDHLRSIVVGRYVTIRRKETRPAVSSVETFEKPAEVELPAIKAKSRTLTVVLSNPV